MKNLNSELDLLVNRVLIGGVLIDDLSLFHGKMGIAIALYNFSRSYDDYFSGLYADKIIDQLYDRKNLNSDISFENGLAGIAWGFCYLLENSFLDADSPRDVLEDIDRAFLKFSYKRFDDKSLNRGVEGVYTYVLARKRLAEKYGEINIFPPEFIKELEESRSPQGFHGARNGDVFSINFFLNNLNFNKELMIEQTVPYGLYEGCSSIILKSSIL